MLQCATLQAVAESGANWNWRLAYKESMLMLTNAIQPCWRSLQAISVHPLGCVVCFVTFLLADSEKLWQSHGLNLAIWHWLEGKDPMVFYSDFCPHSTAVGQLLASHNCQMVGFTLTKKEPKLRNQLNQIWNSYTDATILHIMSLIQ